jgi:hypothetical protein
MAFLRAVFGEDRRPVFVPFTYKPRALVPGPELEQDFTIYKRLVIRCFSIPPTSTMLLFGGELGVELFLRRAETRSSWIAFQAAFLARYPHFGIRLAKASAAITELVVPYKNNERRAPSFPQHTIWLRVASNAASNCATQGRSPTTQWFMSEPMRPRAELQRWRPNSSV